MTPPKSGNIERKLEKNSKTNGWFIGHFIKDDFFHSDDFEVKWVREKKGTRKPGLKVDSETKTFTVLIEGRFKIEFENGDEIEMKNLGDYAAYDAGEVGHTGVAIEDTLLIVIRWPSKR